MVNELKAKKKVTVIPATKKIITEETKRILRVAAYARVSTDDEEQLTSYEAQKRYYTEYIHQNPKWEFAGIFADEGRSGTSTKQRKQFNEMIALCRQRKIDIILTKSISRFARNITDSLLTIRELKALNIAVVFEKERINTLDISSEMLIALHSTFAQAESETISENVKWGIRRKYENGNVSYRYKHWFGYKKGADDQPEIVLKESTVVRDIFYNYLNGWSLDKLLVLLKEQNVRMRSGSFWSKVALKRLLQNEKYKGAVLLQKTFVADVLTKEVKKNEGELAQYYIENAHPAIIPPKIFDRVQEEMARRSSIGKISNKTKTVFGKYSSKYALTELLYCGECGSRYRRVTWNNRGKKKIVWRCISRLDNGRRFCMNSPSMEESDLHNAIVKVLNRFKDDSGKKIVKRNLTSVLIERTSAAYQATLYGKRKMVDHLKAEMLQIVMQGVKAGLDRAEIEWKCEEISQKIRKLESELNGKQTSMQPQSDVQNIDDIYHIIDSYNRLEEYDDLLVRKVIQKITVLSKEQIAVTFKNGYELIQDVHEEQLCAASY